MRRLPSIERKISEIKREDVRVRIMGFVIDKDIDNQVIVVDDGTGRAVVFVDEENIKRVEEGQLVRIIGKVKKGETIEIFAEVVQDFSKLDLNLYEQVRYICEKMR